MLESRLLGIVMLIIILGLSLVIAIIIVNTYERLPETYNPATISPSVDLVKLPMVYIHVLRLIASGNYDEANAVINYLAQSSLGNFQFVKSMNNELSTLMALLAELKYSIGMSTQYLSKYEINESRYFANETLIISKSTSYSLTQVNNSLNSMIYFLTILGYLNSTNIILTPMTASLTMNTQLTPINPLMKELNNTIAIINEEISEITDKAWYILKQNSSQLTPILVKITANASDYFVTIGSAITISGKLEMLNGTGIGNATVSIYYVYEGSHLLATTITKPNGYFAVNITVPQAYTSRLPLIINYTPPTPMYEPSQTMLVLNVLYLNTTYLITIPSEIVWGEPLNITGWASGPGYRNVTVIINNEGFESVTDLHGYFNLSINTASINPGNYSVVVLISPKELYAPVNATYSVAIKAYKPSVSIKVNKYVISGIPFTLTVQIHNVTVSSPWTINVFTNNGEYSKSFSGNSTTIELSLPITTWMGHYYLVIELMPNPPYEGYEITISVFVINPVELSVIIFIIAAVPIAIFLKTPSKGGEASSRSYEVLPPNITLLVKELRYARNRLSSKEALLMYDIYMELLNKLITKYKLKVTGSTTLREVLNGLGNYMDPNVYGMFMKATLVIEKVIYANYTPSIEDVNEMIKIRDAIGGTI
ncbi:MAG: hypothetical protein ACP5NQ_01010 [Vulcanisaeta sp.]